MSLSAIEPLVDVAASVQTFAREFTEANKSNGFKTDPPGRLLFAGRRASGSAHWARGWISGTDLSLFDTDILEREGKEGGVQSGVCGGRVVHSLRDTPFLRIRAPKVDAGADAGAVRLRPVVISQSQANFDHHFLVDQEATFVTKEIRP